MTQFPRTVSLLILLMVVVAVLGCITSTGEGESDPDRIAISGSGVVTLNPSGSHEFTVDLVNGGGDTLPLPPGLSVEWSVGDSDRASIDQNGRLEAGDMLGNVWIYARSAEGEYSDSTAVWVQKPESEPSDFRIRLVFYHGVEQRWRNALQAAAERWEEVIRGKLPPVQTDTLLNLCEDVDYPGGGDGIGEYQPSIEEGVTIVVLKRNTFREGTYVEAIAQPCMRRAYPHPTIVMGTIILNPDHPARTISTPRLQYLVHHEMGHVLGLVGIVLWEKPDWVVRENNNYLYRGHLARHGYFLEYGSEMDELRYDGVHWYYPGVMQTGSPSGFISKLSVGALMDMGYPAAWYGSGSLAEVD